MYQEVLPLIDLAKRHTGTLGAELKDRIISQRDDVFTNIDKLQQSNQRFHRAISDARAVSLQLSTILEGTGKYPEECLQLVELANIIHRATIEQSKLDDALFSHQKSDRLKAFKQSVAVLLDRGGGPHWISTVSKEEIENHGGEINLLYQLLVNLGAGGGTKIDSRTLLKAAERLDLFSTVQRQNLHRRSQQVEELQDEADTSELEMSPDGVFLPTSALVPTQTSKGTWICPACTFVHDSSFGSISCHECNTPCTSLQQPQPSFVEVAKRRPTKTSNTLATQNSASQPNSRSISRPLKIGPTSQTVLIRNSDVADLIGKRGKNHRQLMDETGVNNIYAYQDRVTDDGMCPIEIMGNPKAVQNAVAKIEEKFIHKHLPSRPFVLKQQAPATNGIIWILDTDVPEFIGPRGRHVQKLQAKTGATCISAIQEQVNEAGMCPIRIEGSNDAVQQAIFEIETLFGGMATPYESRSNSSDTCTSGSVKMARPLVEISGHQQSRSDGPRLDHAADEAVFNDVVVGINASSLATDIPEEQPAMKLSGVEAQETHAAARPFTPVETQARLNIMTSQLKSTLGISNIQPSPPPPAVAVATTNGGGKTLLHLLQENQGCLTYTHHAFHLWLESVDILSLDDLALALDDDDFVREEMKTNGLKYFKRYALLKAAIVAATENVAAEHRARCVGAVDEIWTETVCCPSTTRTPAASTYDERQVPDDTRSVMHGLICPIGQVLMVNDPVQAADGYFYERQAIQNWFDTSKNRYHNHNRDDDDNDAGNAIKNTGSCSVHSPLTGDILANLTLTSSPVIRSMARDFAQTNPSAL